MANNRLADQAQAVLRSAGIYNTPADHREISGYDAAGNPVYMTSALRASTDINMGSKMIGALKGTLDPMGVFDDANDSTAFQKLGTVASDGAFILALDQYRKNGDTKGFIGALGNKLNIPLQKQFDDKQTQGGIGSAFAAYNLMNNWETMSPAQKSLGIAGLGINGYKFASGDDMSTRVIAGGNGSPALTVGDSLYFLQSGVNAYDLAKNWDAYSNTEKVIRGGQTVADVGMMAQKYFLNDEATAAGTKLLAQTAEQQVATQSSTALATEGSSTALQTAGADAAAETSLGQLAADALPVIGGALATYQGVKTVKAGWGKGGYGNRTQGAINGLVGGASIAGGLSLMGASLGPIGIAGVIAVSVAGNMAKVGKELHQTMRDQVRTNFVNSGLINKKDYTTTLADGTKVDVGVDGGSRRQWADPSKRTAANQSSKDLREYDVDYTNDLDFASGMAGINFSRLTNGGKSQAVDQVGGQLANAAISNANGREFSQDNFNKMTANMRAFYSKQGISTYKDADELAKQALHDNRIDAVDYTSMQQTFNMVFNNDYKTAKELMLGRWKGVEVAHDTPDSKIPTPTPAVAPKGAAPVQLTPDQTQNSFAERNRLKYGTA